MIVMVRVIVMGIVLHDDSHGHGDSDSDKYVHAR